MGLTVNLWIWTLLVSDEEDAENTVVLSEDERQRADQFVMQKHARRYRAGRAELRRILGNFHGLTPNDVTFSYGEHGKPCLKNGADFNLSHSGNVAVLAVCEGAEVGIDVECHRPVEQDVANRFFSETEANALSHLSGDLWTEGFFLCWTRKEAVVKALGTGLSLPLDSFDVTLDPNEGARLTRLDSENEILTDWSLTNVDLGPKVACAIAVKSKEQVVEVVVRQKPDALPGH